MYILFAVTVRDAATRAHLEGVHVAGVGVHEVGPPEACVGHLDAALEPVVVRVAVHVVAVGVQDVDLYPRRLPGSDAAQREHVVDVPCGRRHQEIRRRSS